MKMQYVSQTLTRGFTLIELMVVLAIIGVTAMVALPQMSQMTQANRMTEHINILSRDIAYTRSEAVTRGQRVSIVSRNGVNWEQGWTIAVNNGGPTLRTYGSGGGTLVIQGNLALTEVTVGGVAGTLQFNSDGSVDNAADIRLCDNTDANSQQYGKLIRLSSTGRIQASTKTHPVTGASICP